MKTSFVHFGSSILILFSILITAQNVVLAQDQSAMPGNIEDMWTPKLPQDGLTLLIEDMDRPGLIRCGKGLPYYDLIIQKAQDKIDLNEYRKNEKSIMLKATLNNNLLFMNKQSQILIKEWIRKEKLDWNLGEAIKGFYMQPVF